MGRYTFKLHHIWYALVGLFRLFALVPKGDNAHYHVFNHGFKRAFMVCLLLGILGDLRRDNLITLVLSNLRSPENKEPSYYEMYVLEYIFQALFSKAVISSTTMSMILNFSTYLNTTGGSFEVSIAQSPSDSVRFKITAFDGTWVDTIDVVEANEEILFQLLFATVNSDLVKGKDFKNTKIIIDKLSKEFVNGGSFKGLDQIKVATGMHSIRGILDFDYSRYIDDLKE